MEGLDLNTNMDGYPHIDSYQGLLQGDGIPGGHGLLPLCIGARSGSVPFVPPRLTGGASGSRKHLASRATRCHAKSGSSTNRAPPMANRRLRGSIAASSSGLDAGGADAMEQEDDNGIENEVSLFVLL